MAHRLVQPLSPLLRDETKHTPIRHTKIVCTLGPSSNSTAKIKLLLKAGMNVARLNFSHGDHKSHGETLANIRQACKESGIVCGIMLDNKGPEIRSGLLKDGKNVVLEKGDEVEILCHVDSLTYVGDKTKFSVDYKDLVKVVSVGKLIKIDDGLIVTKVIAKDEKSGVVRVKVKNTGELGQRKGINLPGTKVNLPTLTDRDKADLKWGAENGVDFIAASFTRTAEDVKNIREVLKTVKGESIHIISKIENQDGLDNFDAILEESDGIMVARGDLGVEIDLEKVVLAQKMMIRKCNTAGKPVITATQMLESMITNPRPTRAEATDVANAVFDGTDCVMLSGETAKGAYPIKAVEVMSKICYSAEAALDTEEIFKTLLSLNAHKKVTRAESIASSAVKATRDLTGPAIIVISRSGISARQIAKYRPNVPVITLTPVEQTYRQCLVSYGLQPHLIAIEQGVDTFTKGITYGKSRGWISPGDEVVLVKGVDGVKGSTNSLQIWEA